VTPPNFQRRLGGGGWAAAAGRRRRRRPTCTGAARSGPCTAGGGRISSVSDGRMLRAGEVSPARRGRGIRYRPQCASQRQAPCFPVPQMPHRNTK
jgi:hypothetical protein